MVHGDALAGGCEMALHCDLRVAADIACFGMPLARLGLIVPFELTCKLIEVIGPAFTKQFLLTAQPIEATRAYEMGLVHQVVPPADLELATYTMARAIAGNAPSLFARLLGGAVTLGFFTYAFVNMGMVSGILPVVGVPLPLVSYGGTSLVTICLGFGILMSIQTHRKLVQT